MKRINLASAFWLFAFCVPSGADLVLVADDVARATILLPAEASPTETFAADELVRCVAVSTGVTLLVAHEPARPDTAVISVGRTEAADALAYAPNAAFPGPYTIRTDGAAVFILGRGDRGTIYAAYDFLRRFVGCRWPMPGAVGEIIPKQTRITIPDVSIDETPAFRFRIAAGFSNDDYIDWATKSRLQLWTPSAGSWASPEIAKRGGYVKGTMHHAFDALVPEDRYFADHPEYYGLLGEVRVPGRASQLCLSDSEVVRIVADGAIQYFNQHPEATFFSLCPNDNQNWCECEPCGAFDTETMERWGRPYPIVSDRYFQFVNQVADALAEKHPGKLLYTFAYQNYTDAPKTHIPRDNVIVSLCHMVPACYSHPLTSPACDQNALFDDLLGGWSAAHGNMWYCAYTCKSMWEQMPWPISRRLAVDIRHLHDAGFQGFYSQGSQAIWGQLGVNFHLMARMLWDPATDVEATLAEYFALTFGPSADAMTDFYNALENGFSRKPVHVHHEVDIWGPEVMTSTVRRRCDAALARALGLADGDEIVSARIAPVAAAYRYAALRVEGLAGESKWFASGDDEGLRDACEAYREVIAIAEANPGGEALGAGSVRRYVGPRFDRLALPYDALFASEEDREYDWQTIGGGPIEPPAGEPPSGWGLPEEQADCGIALSRDRGYESDASLRVWSAVTDEGSPRFVALKHDWVVISTLGERLDVSQGDAIVITARVLVPHDIAETKRGATLGFVGYDAAGDSPERWRPGGIESRQSEATDGWRRIIVARTIDRPGITQIAVRLALSGVGECYFDDIEVLRGTPK